MGISGSGVATAALSYYRPIRQQSRGGYRAVVNGTVVSSDIANLKQVAAAAPFTVKVGTKTIPLVSNDDWNYLDVNGVQAFIDRINGRLDKADDLLNLHFPADADQYLSLPHECAERERSFATGHVADSRQYRRARECGCDRSGPSGLH